MKGTMVEIEKVEEEKISTPSDCDWKLLMGEELVMKVIKRERPRNNKEPVPIQPNDAVMIDFVARIANDRLSTDGPVIQEAKDCFIVVGDGDVLPALELAIRFMHSGSTALVFSHSKFAFSSGTRIHEKTQLTSNTNILFEVVVTQIIVDTSRLNPYFTIQKAVSRKAIANDIYQNEWCPPPKSEKEPSCDAAMARALRLYKKAAQEMETLLGGTYFHQVEDNHPQRIQATQIMMDSLNNIVAVYLRQKQYHEAKQSAVEVLKQDPKNIKALLRAAKASLLDQASTMEEVQASLRAADNEITYKHPQEEKELKRIKAHYKRYQQEYKKKTKEMFSNKLNGKVSDTDLTGNISLSEGNDHQESKTNSAGMKNTEEKGFVETQERKPSSFFYTCVQVLLPLSLFFFYKIFIEGSLEESSSALESTEDTDLLSSNLEAGLEL